MEKTAPGKKFLKIVGTLGAIFGGINSIVVFIGLLTVESWNETWPIVGWMSWEIYFLVAFVIVYYSIFVSIMALVHCANLEKARFLRMLGLISIILLIAMAFIDFQIVGISAIALIPINLTLPILYIIGASKNITAFEKK